MTTTGMTQVARTTLVKLMLAACLLAASQPLVAETYEFSGVVTLCTNTCDSFASLALGTEVTGTWAINTDPNGTWDISNFGSFYAEVFNPGLPIEPWDGTNATSANPLPLTPAIAAIAAAGGSAQPMITSGTTDADNQLNSGTILHEFLVPPFSNNNAWVIFDLGPDGVTLGKVCVFFTTAGCLPGATEVVNIIGTFTLQSTDSDGDGVDDIDDNCTAVANALQLDADGDGIGTACDPDHNQDCVVNFLDLALLLPAFFGDNENFDYNGDGFVNFVDLAQMKSLFFLSPGPSGVPNACEERGSSLRTIPY